MKNIYTTFNTKEIHFGNRKNGTYLTAFLAKAILVFLLLIPFLSISAKPYLSNNKKNTTSFFTWVTRSTSTNSRQINQPTNVLDTTFVLSKTKSDNNFKIKIV